MLARALSITPAARLAAALALLGCSLGAAGAASASAAADDLDREVRLLSPEAGERVLPADLAVVVSLYYASAEVDRPATQLFLDARDVTAEAVFRQDFLIYRPAAGGPGPAAGTHTVRVVLRDRRGEVYHAVSFPVVMAGGSAPVATSAPAAARPLVRGQAEIRSESSGAADTRYLNGGLEASGISRSVRWGARLYLDNQEDARRQPQDRFLLTAQTDNVHLEAGDTYPSLPDLVLSGQRLRGLDAQTHLGAVGLHLAYGQLDRSVEGVALQDTTYADADAAARGPSNTRLRSGLTYTLFDPGTYGRTLLAVRPTFGSGQRFQLGLSYLHARDDPASINLGLRPEENLVVGTDLLLTFDEQHVRLASQASVSMTNLDISGGSFSQAEYDSIGEHFTKSLADVLQRFGDVGSSFITVNENLFPTNPFGHGLPGVALEGSLALRYGAHAGRVTAFRRGAAYRTFGNPFLQADVQGLALSDRVRLPGDRTFADLSLERRSDNTAGAEGATTHYTDLSASASLVPGAGRPAATLGYTLQRRDSDLRLPLPDTGQSTLAIDDWSHRVYLQASQTVGSEPRHRVSAGATYLRRSDRTAFERDLTRLFLQAGVTSSLGAPLATTLSAAYSHSTAPAGSFTYALFSAGAECRLLRERLRLLSSLSPSVGDLRQLVAEAGADYLLASGNALSLRVDRYQGGDSQTVASLGYRFSSDLRLARLRPVP